MCGACIWHQCALRALTGSFEPQCVAHSGGVLHVARSTWLGLAAKAGSLGVCRGVALRASRAVVERRQAFVLREVAWHGRGSACSSV